MLWPKKNSYKEFDNKKKFLRLENSPPPPHKISNGPSLRDTLLCPSGKKVLHYLKIQPAKYGHSVNTVQKKGRFEHKYSTRTKTLYRLPMPRTEAMRRTFFYSSIKELNAHNLEPTTSFSLMKTTLTNKAASNYTVDNLKVKMKLFWFLKFPWFF